MRLERTAILGNKGPKVLIDQPRQMWCGVGCGTSYDRAGVGTFQMGITISPDVYVSAGEKPKSEEDRYRYQLILTLEEAESVVHSLSRFIDERRAELEQEARKCSE